MVKISTTRMPCGAKTIFENAAPWSPTSARAPPIADAASAGANAFLRSLVWLEEQVGRSGLDEALAERRAEAGLAPEVAAGAGS